MAEAPTNLNQKYFAGLLALMDRSGIDLSRPRKPYSGQFQIIDSWPRKIDSAVNILKSKKEIRVDLTLKSDSANKQFLVLEKAKRDVQEIAGKVEWQPQPAKERQIVAVLKADPTDETDWPRQHAWLAARLVAFRLAFGPRIEGF